MCPTCYTWCRSNFLLEKDGSTTFLSGDGMSAGDFNEAYLAPFVDEFELYLDQTLGKQQNHAQTYTGPEHSCAVAGDGPSAICITCNEMRPILAGKKCRSCIVKAMPKSGDKCQIAICPEVAKPMKGVCEKCNKILLVMPRNNTQQQQYTLLCDRGSEWHKLRFVPGYRKSASGLQKHVDDCIVPDCKLKCMNALTGGCDVHSVMKKIMMKPSKSGYGPMPKKDQDYVLKLQTEFMEQNNRCVICPVHQQKQWLKPAKFAEMCPHHFNNFVTQDCSYKSNCTGSDPKQNYDARVLNFSEAEVVAHDQEEVRWARFCRAALESASSG
eukprot:SAG11_NODE_4757_length_1778_cov_3.282311_2_plen_326_part_00